MFFDRYHLGFVLILFAVLDAGDSLTCFKCVSPRGGLCDDPINTTLVKSEKCTGIHNACLLLNVTRGSFSEIRRECAPIDYCSQNDTHIRNTRQIVTTSFARACNACSWSYCNSAPNITPTLAFSITSLLFIKNFMEKIVSFSN